MKRVMGMVLVRETGIGIPNLVVTVFDSDCSAEDVRGHRDHGQLLKAVGRRLSSVLTDRDGRFDLPAADLEFPGNEPRPNLILAVFAPEDVQDPAHPFPLPPEQRLLYVSTMPRSDVGAQEAYVIRLLQAQIDRFRIPVGPYGTSIERGVRDLSDTLLNSWALREGMRERLEERVRLEQKRHQEARQVARAKLQHFSALPLHMRSADAQAAALVIRGKSELGEALPRLQDRAVNDALSKMKNSEVKPTMQLRLSVDAVESLGLTVKDGKITGKVRAADLTKVLRSTVNVLDLVRARDADDVVLDDLEQRYLTTTDDAPNPAPRRTPRSPR